MWIFEEKQILIAGPPPQRSPLHLSHSSANHFRSQRMDLVSDLIQSYLFQHHLELEHQLMTSDSQAERVEIDHQLKCVEHAIAELGPAQ